MIRLDYPLDANVASLDYFTSFLGSLVLVSLHSMILLQEIDIELSRFGIYSNTWPRENYPQSDIPEVREATRKYLADRRQRLGLSDDFVPLTGETVGDYMFENVINAEEDLL